MRMRRNRIMRKECKCEEMKIYRKIGGDREQQYQNEVFDFGLTVSTSRTSTATS
jgi:hypothetical protein